MMTGRACPGLTEGEVMAAEEGGACRTVYVVETVGYDDHGVRGAFSTREGAERFAAAFGRDDDVNVEACELDRGLPLLDAGLRPYYVEMLATGEQVEVRAADPDTREGDAGRLCDWFRGEPARAFNVDVWATDEAHAVRLANERREALLGGVRV
jgi:hypothetical protein